MSAGAVMQLVIYQITNPSLIYYNNNHDNIDFNTSDYSNIQMFQFSLINSTEKLICILNYINYPLTIH